MKSYPKVTIMIATYNQERYIARTIEKALSQDYTNYEIIISDDSSSDNTGKIAKLYSAKGKVKYYRNKKNIGRVANYRKILTEYATGTYVIMLDGDDYYIDDKFITTAINRIKLNKELSPLMYVACKRIVSENYKKNIVHKINNDYEIIKGTKFVLKINSKYHFSHLTTIYHRESAIKLGFYEKNIISSDKESLLRLALNGYVIVTRDIVAEWRFTGKNESMVADINSAIENLKWISSVSNYLKNKTSFIKTLLWIFYMKMLYVVPIFNSLKKRKNLSKDTMYKLVKAKVIFLLLLYLPYYIIKKIKIKFKTSITL